MANAPKNAAAPVNEVPAAADRIDTTDWIDERFGNAPYWNPKEGESVVLRLVAKDERDPEFIRFLVEAMEPVVVYSGPKESAKAETLTAGQTFTLSSYYAVDEKFGEYMDLGIFPVLKLTAVEKVKTKDPKRTVWKFTAKVAPDTAKQLMEARKAKALNGATQAKRPELETET